MSKIVFDSFYVFYKTLNTNFRAMENESDDLSQDLSSSSLLI